MDEQKLNEMIAVKDNTRHKLERGLAYLFIKLSRVNWLRGGSLGQARYTALRQIDAYVAGQVKNNPNNKAVGILQDIAAEHRSRWARAIITSHKAEDNVPLSLRERLPEIAKAESEVTAAQVKMTNKIHAHDKNDAIQMVYALEKVAEHDLVKRQLIREYALKLYDREKGAVS